MIKYEDYVDEFLEIYLRRPYRSNPGGIGLNQAFGLYSGLRYLSPTTVIESGVWMGWSTWLIQQVLPDAQIYCLDPRLDRRQFVSDRAEYSSLDFRDFDWDEIDKEKTVCFFDDHQNQVARLREMIWQGFSVAIFDDNWPSGVGDVYSLRKAAEGAGQPKMQMTESLRKKGAHGLFRRLEHFFLMHHYASQHRIVRPNRTDGANINAWLAEYEELPSLLPPSLGEETLSATGFASSKQGLSHLIGEKMKQIEENLIPQDSELSESYMTLVRLRTNRDHPKKSQE